MNPPPESSPVSLESEPAVEALQAELASMRRLLEQERDIRRRSELLAEERTRALYDSQSEMHLLATVARAANESPDFEGTLFTILGAVCQFGEWQLGHVLLREPECAALESTTLWYRSDPELASEFIDAQVAFGAVGANDPAMQALEVRSPSFIPDLSVRADLARYAGASTDKLVCAYVFPVVAEAAGGAAVVELFSHVSHTEGELMFDLLPQIAAQLSQFLDRHWTGLRLRRTQRELEARVKERTDTLSRALIELNTRMAEQRRMQHALEVRNRAIHAASSGIIIVDALQAHRPVVYCNPAFEKLSGYSRDEITDKACRFLEGPESDKADVRLLSDASRTGTPCQVTIRNYRKDGSAFWNRITISPVRDAHGMLTHFVGIQEDVTDQRRTEECLREAKHATDAACAEMARVAKMKDEFLAAMSHELRTPLNAVIGLTQSLQESVYGALTESQQAPLRMIEESGRHLLSLINDLLDLSKIEAGQMKLDLDEVDVGSLAQSSLRFVRDLGQKKRLRMALSVDASLELVRGDVRRLKQVLVNLLSNAVKFTPEGGSIGLEVNPSADATRVEFVVWDTGIGISPENIARLFKPFQQIDSRLARRFEGTGLGLALVKRMVELHGGAVSVESVLGQGSRFRVSVPCRGPESVLVERGADVGQDAGAGAASVATPVAAQTEHQASVSLKGVRVLLAEDNPVNQCMLTDYFATLGCEMYLADDGAVAVAQAKRLTPDVILMDVQMPNVDGLEATRRLRADEDGKHIPIIALTALAMTGDRLRCLEAGADRYLSKPVDLRELVKTIGDLLPAATKARLAAERPTASLSVGACS